MQKGLIAFLCFLSPLFLFAQTPKDVLIRPVDSLDRGDTTGQKDLIGIFLKVTKIQIHHPRPEKGRRVYFTVLPLSTTVPGGGNALITSTQAGFYLGDRRETFLSTVNFSPSYNFKGQYNFPFRANVWSPSNKWNYQLDTRFSIYPRYTWGLGGDHAEDHKILVRYSYYRLYGSILKRITPYLLFGPGYDLDYNIHIRPDLDTVDIGKFVGYKYGTVNHSNSFSHGVTLNLLLDTRYNLFNPIPGMYFNAVYRYNPSWLGSNTTWHSLYLDWRKYIGFSDRGQNMLGIWSYYWTTLGSNAPYFMLPAIGTEPYQRSGRGIYPMRYVAKSLFYVETEYRRDITHDGLFGFVAFANMTTASEPESHQYSYLHPAAGAGLRIKFNKHSGSNIGIDYGVSKHYNAIYFNLGETF